MLKIHVLTCLALLLVKVFAGPFDSSKVAADAKWVIHLDADAFRKSAVGQYAIEKFLKPKLEENEQFKKLNLSINLQNISGLTAYGPAFEKQPEGILVLTTTADVKKDLDTLVGMAALSENEKKDVVMLQEKPFLLYSIKDQIYVAPGGPGNSVIIAKSREMLEQGREVALGTGENLSKSKGLSDYPATNEKSFLMVMAEGFNEIEGIPPQAHVLREAKGARVLLGEANENLFFNLVFKAKDESASTKIQQILQGIVALVSLSQPDKDLTELASNSKVASAGSNVSVELKMPTAKAVKVFEEKHGDDHRPARRNREKRRNQESKPAREEAKAAQETN
jgi:hypothetical protein